MLFIYTLNIRIQDQQSVRKSGKVKKLLLIKVFLIGATIKMVLTGVTVTAYRKNGNSGQSLMKMKLL